LIGIRAAFLTHGDGFPAPNQFGATLTEVAPAAPGQIARPAVGRAVPAFHRQDGEAIADAHAAGLERRGERRRGRGRELAIELEADP
jgi:hypothetical protein